MGLTDGSASRRFVDLRRPAELCHGQASVALSSRPFCGQPAAFALGIVTLRSLRSCSTSSVLGVVVAWECV